jgi:quinol monooxygenase YgiN
VSKVSVFSTFTCKDGKKAEIRSLLADMVEAAVDEPGIEVLSFHEGDANAFWFFALLTDRAAIRQHRESFAARLHRGVRRTRRDQTNNLDHRADGRHRP